MGTFKFDNGGVSACISKSWSGRVLLFKFAFPLVPAITLGVYAGGSISFSVSWASTDKILRMSASGSLTASAEIKAGWDPVLSLSAGATGTIINVTGSANASSSGVNRGVSISGGQIGVYVVAKAGGKQVWRKDHTLFGGWSS